MDIKTFTTEAEQFKETIYSVRSNFQQIQQKKLDALNIMGNKMTKGEGIKESLEELKYYNRMEEKYFGLVYLKFTRFYSQVLDINRQLAGANDSLYQQEERELIAEGVRYWALLKDICASLDQVFVHARDRIKNEKQHINATDGGFFTRDKQKNFIQQYEGYLDSFKEQASIETIVKDIDKKRALIEYSHNKMSSMVHKLGARIGPLGATGVIVLGVTLGKTIQAGIVEGLYTLAIGGLFCSAAMIISRNRLKNVVGHYKYTL
jgi:hypothetical protein